MGKYVDDVNAGERLFIHNAASLFSQNKEIKTIRAIECERRFANIVQNSKMMGMLVNQRKTQLICLSPALHSEVRSFIDTDDGRIDSSENLTLLGFRFGNRPTIAAHLELIREKFNSRSWMLRHLKKSAVPDRDILTIYTSTIRPVIEYACCVYHPMMSMSDSNDLEKLQRRALKIIYGFDCSYKDAMEKAGILTLEERRREIFRKFTAKTSANQRFADWFPSHRPYLYELRAKKKYEELKANTDRLYKSPLFTMRRLLNNM